MGIYPIGKSGQATSKLQGSANTSLACLLPSEEVGAPAEGSGGGGWLGRGRQSNWHPGFDVTPHSTLLVLLEGATVIYFSWASLLGDLREARQGSGDKGK